MNAIFIIVGAACFLLAILLGLMTWAFRSGQFEDLDNPAHRILLEELHEYAD